MTTDRMNGTGKLYAAQAAAKLSEARTAKARADLQRRAIRAAGKASAGVVGRRGHSIIGDYSNIGSTRLRPSNAPRGGQASSHRDLITLDNLRKRCQSLERKSLLARGLVNRKIELVCSDGFSVQARTEDDEWNKEAERLFNKWAGGIRYVNVETDDGTKRKPVREPGECDIRGMSCLDEIACNAVARWNYDGDMGIALTDVNGGTLQQIEAERITNPGGLTTNTPEMSGGVRLDAAGRPVSFCVAEWEKYSGGMFTTQKVVEVDADHFLFLPNPIRQQPGSTRGEPQLAASLDRFDYIDGFEEAALAGARVQACLAVYKTVARPDLHMGAWAGSVVDRASDIDNSGGTDIGTEDRLVDIESGTISTLGIGEDIKSVSATQPGPQYEPFMLMQISAICADLGIPLSVATLDARWVNLSTIRCVMRVAWRRVKREQAALVRTLYCPVYRWRTAMNIRMGLLPFRDDWDAHSWTCPSEPVMDPKSEIEAARLAIDGRFSTYADQCQLLGYGDAPDIHARLAKELDNLKELGAEAVSVPGSGQTPATTDNADNPTGNPTTGKPQTTPSDDGDVE